MTQTLPTSALASRVLLPFAAGYFLSYLYRTVNAVLAPEIARGIELDAGDIGLMTGVYFVTFGAFQLPLGILLDRFGPRRVEALLLVFAALGAATFALADSVPVLVAGRALVGLGVASCLMAPLKANVQWFERARLPLMNGIILGAGGLGAVAATVPVQAALTVLDWRGVYAGLAALTLAAAALLWRTVPDKPMPAGGGSLAEQMADVVEIFRNRLFWRIAPISAVSMGSFMAIQGLWAGPWLRDVAGLSPDAAAFGLTVMAVAMALGYLSMGAIAERLARFGISTVAVGGVGMTVFALATLAMALGWSGAPLLLAAIYGFSGTSSAVNYAVLSQTFPLRVAGRVNTSLNLTMFLTAFVLQWGLGGVIRLWPAVEGRWPVEAYGVALAIPAVLQVLGLLWFIPAARTARPG
jgi:MFS family permease